MKYCPNCAATLTIKIPADDSRERHVCEACGSIHYQNPRNVVGSIPVYGTQVLLCRRAIEPRLGYWTLPAGFMELGESTSHGAARETLEESGAAVEIGLLYSLLNVPHAEQVHLFYLAKMTSPEFCAGEESLEVALFEEHEIPWGDIAFPTVKQTLEWFFADRASGALEAGKEFHVRSRDVLPSERI
ncbi:NUDIX hydrolase [Polynucleobacter sp. AP-Kolm-20A-A1]|uniref:NUDIX hydrolase n=1 Tax=Polynucleobacter sp. AP-Kolm-20A-A1 TaxID=2081041 RepID=UPI001BFD0DBB|nr:NUDIX hydrolase [Polynucleobacter sp. AP-Kolm-20A-A1]QWE21318.1 NUDIX hydrolase [Polynucleobacter sp. AP-Kolm-20A-A1]